MLNEPNLNIPKLISFEKSLKFELFSALSTVKHIFEDQVKTMPGELIKVFSVKMAELGHESFFEGSGFYLDSNWDETSDDHIFSLEQTEKLNKQFNLDFRPRDYCAALSCWLFAESKIELLYAIDYCIHNEPNNFQYTMRFDDYDCELSLTIDVTPSSSNLTICCNQWGFSVDEYSACFPELKADLFNSLRNASLSNLEIPSELFSPRGNNCRGYFYIEGKPYGMYESEYEEYLDAQQGCIEQNLTEVKDLLSKFATMQSAPSLANQENFAFVERLSDVLASEPPITLAKFGVEECDRISNIFDLVDDMGKRVGNHFHVYELAEAITLEYFSDKPLENYVHEYMAFIEHNLVSSIPSLVDSIQYSKDVIQEYGSAISLANNIEAIISSDNLMTYESDAQQKSENPMISNSI
ncbi:hypothetical protein GCM10011607_12490 [Shewanella inventionis]|uniref:Uncharacterized protein n=1 Tax=Shewanella inventionis TaxID=1738770 RepID=A0ABQ1IXA4_9GAMM|nr:hypothetical protein [Shewanella inventionis]GGB53436.1 hypothetical protein GCM10011607_12490 [Shewanella inventionis]